MPYKDPVKRKTYLHYYYIDNKPLFKERQIRSQMKIRYGVTPEIYTETFDNQEGRCAICSTHQLDLTGALEIDHCHKSGKFRKLLCGPCNRGLGCFRDNIERVEKALEYLKEFSNG